MQRQERREKSMADKEEVKPIVVPSYLDQTKKEKGSLFFKRRTKIIKSKEQKELEKREKAKKKREGRMLRQTPQVLPFLQIHDDYILLKKGVMDILQIDTRDLHSLNEDDLQYLLYGKTRFLRSYYHSYKEVVLNFPSNTEKQKEYWLKKRERTDDPLRLKFIDRKLFEFDFLENERTNREFFLFIYADNRQQLEERRTFVVRGMMTSFPLKKLTKRKKQDILFLLCNQNTKLT